MELPDHPIKLSDHDCELLEDLISRFPKTGIELTLVASGVKPGDLIGAYELTPVREAFYQTINSLEAKERMITEEINGKIIFYNSSIEEDILKRAVNFFNGMGNDDLAVGAFYGYPACCCKANESNEAVIKMPFTEHFWCSDECKESLRIAELYKKAVMINAPGFIPLLERLNCLGNNATNYYTIICELMNKVKKAD